MIVDSTVDCVLVCRLRLYVSLVELCWLTPVDRALVSGNGTLCLPASTLGHLCLGVLLGHVLFVNECQMFMP